MKRIVPPLVISLLLVCSITGLQKQAGAPKQKCSFLKALIDSSCEEPALENGLSIAVEKEECKSKWRLQKMQFKGCKPKKIMTKDCQGRCNSVWFPGPDIGNLGCFGCFPVAFIYSPVTFDCPARKAKTLTRMIPIVTKCECQNFKCSPLVDVQHKYPRKTITAHGG